MLVNPPNSVTAIPPVTSSSNGIPTASPVLKARHRAEVIVTPADGPSCIAPGLMTNESLIIVHGGYCNWGIIVDDICG